MQELCHMKLPSLFNPPIKAYIYDIEIYPNFFYAHFHREDGETYEFYGHQLEELKEFLDDQTKILIGFNNFAYDDILMKSIYFDRCKNIKDIYLMSQLIIDEGKKPFNQRSQNIKDLMWKIKKPWAKSVDLMLCLKRGKEFTSLKEYGVRIKMNRIQDLPYKWDTELDDIQKVEVVDYCVKGDINTTLELYKICVPAIQARIDSYREYGVDVLDKHEAGVGEHLMKNLYARSLNINTYDKRFKEKTLRDFFKVKELIPEWVAFKDPKLSAFLDNLKSIEIHEDKLIDELNKTVEYAGLIFSFGAGGVHTKDEVGVFKADEVNTIVDVDVASYYPNLMIKNKFYPAHLGKEFIDVLETITKRRLQAKANGEAGIAGVLKIVINSVFGKSNDRHSFLFDPNVTYSVTILGQLALMMLIERFNDRGIKVISANTDGVIVYMDRRKGDLFKEAQKEWMELTKLTLEETEYEKYVRRDVNAYIALGTDGSIKKKGVFDVNIYKKADAPVVRNAMIKHFLEGVPVDESIRSEEDILEFSYYFRKRHPFDLYHGDKKVQDTVRWYVSTEGEQLQKRDTGAKTRVIRVPNGNSAKLINFVQNKKIPKDLDYSYYINEAKKTINEIDTEFPVLKEIELASMKTMLESGKYSLPKIAETFKVSKDFVKSIKSLNESEKSYLNG